MGLSGAMWALVLSAGASAVVLTGGTLARVAWRMDRALVGRLVRFGAPLVLGALALPVIHVGDRYVLKWLTGPEEVGVYDLAARLAGVLNMLFVQSFQQAFAVVGLKALAGGAGGPAFYRSTFRHYVVGTGWAAAGLALLAYDVVGLISADPGYLRADAMVFPLCVGFLLYGLYIVFANVLIAAERTRTIAWVLLLAVAVNLGLNVVLVPRLGGVGAAVATLVAYGVMAAVAAVAAERLIRVGYPWRVLASTLLIVAGLWVLAQASVGWGVGARLALRVGLLALYPALVVAAGLYRPAELRHYLGVLRRLRRREHGA
jgi:O-antigen/teichoic acid export membrane protein